MTLQIATVPAPVGGLNAFDSLLGMPETDAISLINFGPQAYGLQLRLGYEEHANGMPAEVKTIAAFNGQASSHLFAWAGAEMYDVTSPGPVGAPIVSGLSTSVWNTTGMVNSGGTQLVAFSGSDDGIVFDNASGVHRLTLGDGVTPYTWNGVDPKFLGVCTTHQRRLWAAEEGT